MFNKINKILEKIENFRFKRTIKNIKNTKPISYIYDDKVTIVSMVGHDTVFMYLLAIKSFMSHFGYGTIEVINDSSLTEQDQQLLKEHIPYIRFSNANEIDTYKCPSYISWKRLFRITELIQNSYVIQLDSDIVVTGPLTEISNKVENNSGFLIGSGKWSTPVSTSFLHSVVKQWNNNHVQSSAELHFKDINFFKPNIKYLRGCAGFSGYPKNAFTKQDVSDLSNEIEEKIGRKKWSGWGSEQTATLCLISKSFESSILPWPKYQNHRFPITKEPNESMILTHFIGSNRFRDSVYRNICRNFISWNS